MTESRTKIYLRPSGFLSGLDAANAIHAEQALPLAGGPLGFSLIEIIRRTNHTVQSRTVRVSDRSSMDRLMGEEALQVLTAARPEISSLAMDATHIMGVLNVTPDSFSDGGRFTDVAAAIKAGLDMHGQGASIVDVGGESTRPGAEPVDAKEEINRVVPVIEGLTSQGLTNISIDSRNAQVISAAIAAGATIVNDVSALTHDPGSMAVVAQSGLPVILMHAQGDPKSMQDRPAYDHVALDVFDYLKSRIDACEQAGILRSQIIVDPGIGFGKTLDHNLALLSRLSLLHGLGCPILLGASRKSFIAKLDNNADVSKRLPGSLAAAAAGLRQGAQMLRVHDVPEMKQFLAVSWGIDGSRQKF